MFLRNDVSNNYENILSVKHLVNLFLHEKCIYLCIIFVYIFIEFLIDKI